MAARSTDSELDRCGRPQTPAADHVLVAEPALARARGLLGAGLQCSRKTPDHPMARFLGAARSRPHFHYEITVRGEMRPAEHNRVLPTAERDAFGLPRLAARCVLDAGDYRNAEETLRALGETLMRLERGRVRVNNDRIYLQVDGQGHTLGTTRMGTDASTSVVDGDCRVHGYANLFVAGSSVFPSGGYANPTLTIVALALRLADRLAGRLDMTRPAPVSRGGPSSASAARRPGGDAAAVGAGAVASARRRPAPRRSLRHQKAGWCPRPKAAPGCSAPAAGLSSRRVEQPRRPSTGRGAALACACGAATGPISDAGAGSRRPTRAVPFSGAPSAWQQSVSALHVLTWPTQVPVGELGLADQSLLCGDGGGGRPRLLAARRLGSRPLSCGGARLRRRRTFWSNR